MQTDQFNSDTPVMCQHCKRYGNGKLCGQCGENLYPKRITLHKIIKDIPDVFFDLEFGLLYTLRTFLTRPGAEIKEYFAGDRQKHYKPLKFILFIGGLVTLLMVKGNIDNGVPLSGFEDFTQQWNSAVLIIQFPIVAFFTSLIFKTRKYTYGEHLVANAYLIGEVSIFHIFFFPIYLLVNHTWWITLFFNLYIFWIFGYYTYAFYDWFYAKKTAAGFFKSLAVTIALFIVASVAAYILLVIIYYLLIKNKLV